MNNICYCYCQVCNLHNFELMLYNIYIIFVKDKIYKKGPENNFALQCCIILSNYIGTHTIVCDTNMFENA